MASMKRQFDKRLMKEFQCLQKSRPHGIAVSLPDDNFHEWEAVIPGPADSLYQGGRFKVKISIPDNYPLKPPLITFVTSIYHLNVNQGTGQVCLGFLSPDKWSPSCDMEQIIQALFSLLSKPETENSMDHELLNKFHHFSWEYEKMAKASAFKAK